MFAKENRYITIGIDERLDLQLQLLIWSLVDDLKIEKDYLQVFNLRRDGKFINIEHSLRRIQYIIIRRRILGWARGQSYA